MYVMFHSTVIRQGDGLPTKGPAQEKLSRLVPDKTSTRPKVCQPTSQDSTKEVFISVPYIQGLSKEFRRIFKYTKAQIIFKGCNTFESSLMYPKDKIPLHLCKYKVHQWICPEETCNSSYIGESSRCLKNMIKEHNNSTTSVIYQHSSTYNLTKQTYQILNSLIRIASKLSEGPGKAIHIRTTNPVLNCNLGKMCIPNIFNELLRATNNSSAGISSNPNICQNTNNSKHRQFYKLKYPQNPPTPHTLRSTRAVCLHN